MTSVADAVQAMKAKFNPAAAAGLDLGALPAGSRLAGLAGQCLGHRAGGLDAAACGRGFFCMGCEAAPAMGRWDDS